jgi:hypothetical protein
VEVVVDIGRAVEGLLVVEVVATIVAVVGLDVVVVLVVVSVLAGALVDVVMVMVLVVTVVAGAVAVVDVVVVGNTAVIPPSTGVTTTSIVPSAVAEGLIICTT